jgi:hypothetical protein
VSKIIRVDETAQQRVDRLRAEMHAVGTVPATPPGTPPSEAAASEEALERDRVRYVSMKLDAVLELEIKTGLALPYDKLWPKDRQQLIKAGVGLMLARAKMGRVWAEDLDDDDDGAEDEA